jgi:hypothetical protein
MNYPRINPKPLTAVLLTALIAIGCEDSTTEPAEPLTLQETEALYLGLQHVAMDTMPEIISATADGAVIACPQGGQLTFSGGTTEEQAVDTARLATNITLVPDGCMLSSEGHTFTLDGNPNVQLEVNITLVGTTFEFLFDGSLTGGVDWQLGDRSGTCMIDLTLEVEIAEPPTSTFSGTMCEHEVDFVATGVVSMGGGG